MSDFAGFVVCFYSQSIDFVCESDREGKWGSVGEGGVAESGEVDGFFIEANDVGAIVPRKTCDFRSIF